MLGVVAQIKLAVIDAPTAARRLRKRSAAWLAIYLAAATIVLGTVAWAIIANQEHILDLLLDYVMPEDWRFASKLLIQQFFAQQEQAVITNATIVASLLVVQITLFPIKEMVSKALEQDAQLVAEPMSEHPLWFQAWEEIKLFLFVVVSQGTIFWIGYSSDPGRELLSAVLSYVVLFASLAADFLSPVLQRHKLRYSSILKTLLSHPFLTFGFGALFALPAIVAAKIAVGHPTWSFTTQLCVSLGAQVIGIALAAIGGTVAGAPLIPDARTRKRSHPAARVLTWVVLLGLLGWNAYRFIAVGRSLHHKSQILKCEYTVDWGSFRANTPSAFELASALRKNSITVGIGFDVTIHNPTSTLVEIEDNTFEVRQRAQLVAETRLPPLRIDPGTTQKVAVELPLTIKPSQVLRIRELITTEGWSMTLFVRVADNFTFPIYVLAAPLTKPEP
ncbi:MAG: hypothetical protein H0T42_05280 [Deltaproteobacteria bacterium]|nr:hypothetical protein [Deltaproteobacteria bacterium]